MQKAKAVFLGRARGGVKKEGSYKNDNSKNKTVHAFRDTMTLNNDFSLNQVFSASVVWIFVILFCFVRHSCLPSVTTRVFFYLPPCARLSC